MKNYVQEGKYLTLTAPYAVASGEGMLVGMIFGVFTGGGDKTAAVQPPGASGSVVEVLTEGVCTLAKATGTAWLVGDSIYWDNAAKKCTKTATANKFIGYATAAAASGDTVGNVLLGGVTKDVAG